MSKEKGGKTRQGHVSFMIQGGFGFQSKLIVEHAPCAGLSFRLGCGGENINSAHRSNLGVRISLGPNEAIRTGNSWYRIASLSREFISPPPQHSLKERPPQGGNSYDQRSTIPAPLAAADTAFTHSYIINIKYDYRGVPANKNLSHCCCID